MTDLPEVKAQDECVSAEHQESLAAGTKVLDENSRDHNCPTAVLSNSCSGNW